MSVCFEATFVNCRNNSVLALKKMCTSLSERGDDAKTDETADSITIILKRNNLSYNFFANKKSLDSVLMAIYNIAPLTVADNDSDKNARILKARLDEFIETTKLVYDYLSPEFVVATDEEEMTKHRPIKKVFVGWLTFFGPQIARKFMEKKLLAAPAYKTEALADGGILIRASYGLKLSRPQKGEIEKLGIPTGKYHEVFDEDVQIMKITQYLGIEETDKDRLEYWGRLKKQSEAEK